MLNAVPVVHPHLGDALILDETDGERHRAVFAVACDGASCDYVFSGRLGGTSRHWEDIGAQRTSMAVRPGSCDVGVLDLAYLICAFMFGRAPGSQAPHFWAWILADPGSVTAIALAAASVGVGISLIPGLAQHLSKRQLGT